MKIETEQTVIGISGMTCGECVKTVRAAIDTVAGVSVQSVQIGSAVVLCDDAEACGRACKAIEDAGYSAKKDSSPSAKAAVKEKESLKLASQDMISEGGGSAMPNDGSRRAAVPDAGEIQKTRSVRQ